MTEIELSQFDFYNQLRAPRIDLETKKMQHYFKYQAETHNNENYSEITSEKY